MRLALILLAALTLAPPEAWACSFELPTKEYAQKFIKEHYREYDYIIKAQILEIAPIDNRKLQESISFVEVTKSLKGSISGKVKILYPWGGSACGFNLKLGEENLFLLKKSKNGEYQAALSIISLTASIAGEEFLLQLSHSDPIE